MVQHYFLELRRVGGSPWRSNSLVRLYERLCCLCLSLLSQPIPSTSQTSPASDGLASSSASPPRKPLETHPFYRVPDVATADIPRDFSLVKARLHGFNVAHPNPVLLTLHTLLKKQTLDRREAEHLVTATERLVGFALQHFKQNIWALRSGRAVEHVGFAFLIVDTVFSACEALGSKSHRQEWWPEFMESVMPIGMPAGIHSSSSVQSAMRLANLTSLLETYKSGTRPEAYIVVSLKQLLICSGMFSRFRAGFWNDWRADDREWNDSS